MRRHYGKTLQHWAENFENTLDEIRKTKDERFIRMWRLYLNACAASFYTGNIDLHQFVFTKGISDSIPWTRSYMYNKKDAFTGHPLDVQEQIVPDNDTYFRIPSVHLHHIHHLN